MRAVITGQVGLDKKPLLARVCDIAGADGNSVAVFNLGDRMYTEAPDVAPGKILDLPLSRLNGLRRSVFKDVLAEAEQTPHVLVNTHATFRWRHGLFSAFDYDHMKAFGADLYVVLVDNVDRVHHRLVRDGHTDHTLKDIMVWREEEILATEILSQVVGGHGRCFVMARGDDSDDWAAVSLARLLLDQAADAPKFRKAYLSFPMSHVMGTPEVQAEIDAFRIEMKRQFICFDPADMEEKYLSALALQAAESGQRTIHVGPPDARAALDTAQLLEILPDIDGQIYARDFKLIDQADMIVSLIPAMPGGQPAISSGVERELQHAHEATKDVFVIWTPAADPSPFITETATKVFPSATDAMRFFTDNNYLPHQPLGTLFE